MKGMRWSWPELRAAPPYVQRYCLDFLAMTQQAQAEQVGKMSKRHE